MTALDLKNFCAALGFMTTALQKEVPDAAGAQARKFAGLIEEFCLSNRADDAAMLDHSIAHYREARQDRQLLTLPKDRPGLIALHDRLALRQLRRAQTHFHEVAPDYAMRQAIMALIDEEIDGARAIPTKTI